MLQLDNIHMYMYIMYMASALYTCTLEYMGFLLAMSWLRDECVEL